MNEFSQGYCQCGVTYKMHFCFITQQNFVNLKHFFIFTVCLEGMVPCICFACFSQSISTHFFSPTVHLHPCVTPGNTSFNAPLLVYRCRVPHLQT